MNQEMGCLPSADAEPASHLTRFRKLPVALALAALIGLAMPLATALPASAIAVSPQETTSTPELPALGPDGYLRGSVCRNALAGDLFLRTELFFGLSRPGGTVSEREFQDFVDAEVTPRFPDGLTLLAGNGQFRDASGSILKEGSRVLILLYKFNHKNNRAIEAIRSAYIEAFDQQSVLRVDDRSCVSF